MHKLKHIISTPGVTARHNKFFLAAAAMAALFIYLSDPLNPASASMTLLTGESFMTWAVFLAGMLLALYGLNKAKKLHTNQAAAVIVMFFVLTVALSFYVKPAASIASSAAPVLSPNWFEGLNWIRNNTAECSTIVTYWDPGHFIRAIGGRTVVFDGGSQNHVFETETNDTRNGTVIETYDSGVTRVMKFDNGLRTTARIQDVTATMLTANESLAVEILRDYRKPGCDEMYYIASSDLISKSVWWTYFSTWAPNKKGTCGANGIASPPKGDCYIYSVAGRTGSSPSEGSIIYEYTTENRLVFVLRYNPETDETESFLRQDNNLYRIANTFFFRKDGSSAVSTAQDAEVQGMTWVDPGKNTIVYMQPQLRDSMFTRLFFFNGAGLENFELVNQWGGEVKLFRVKFDNA